MQRLERFHVIMYSKSGSAATVNDGEPGEAATVLTWPTLLEAIPPSQAALLEHLKRSILQACFIWRQAATCHQVVPNFSAWGWKFDERSQQWVPFWTTLADASKEYALLLHCGCKKAYRGHCKCSKAGVRCTSLCKCEGGCVNNDNQWLTAYVGFFGQSLLYMLLYIALYLLIYQINAWFNHSKC